MPPGWTGKLTPRNPKGLPLALAVAPISSPGLESEVLGGFAPKPAFIQFSHPGSDPLPCTRGGEGNTERVTCMGQLVQSRRPNRERRRVSHLKCREERGDFVCQSFSPLNSIESYRTQRALPFKELQTCLFRASEGPPLSCK